MDWAYTMIGLETRKKYSNIPYPRHYNAHILFFIMTFWGAFYSKKRPKNGLLTKKCALFSKKCPKMDFWQGVQSIQAAYCNDADTVECIYYIYKYMDSLLGLYFSSTHQKV